jgi:hypothetical protein
MPRCLGAPPTSRHKCTVCGDTPSSVCLSLCLSVCLSALRSPFSLFSRRRKRATEIEIRYLTLLCNMYLSSLAAVFVAPSSRPGGNVVKGLYGLYVLTRRRGADTLCILYETSPNIWPLVPVHALLPPVQAFGLGLPRHLRIQGVAPCVLVTQLPSDRR